MQHFVVEHVLEKPKRNKRLIQERIDPDDAIFFLNCSEDKIFLRTALLSPAPDHFVPAQAATEMALIKPIENRAEIEMFSLMLQVEVPLHRQFRVRCFPFRLFCHDAFLREMTPNPGAF
jgi:hypothetical protein